MVSILPLTLKAIPQISVKIFGNAGGREVFNRAVSNAFSWYHRDRTMPEHTKKFLASMSALGDLIDIVWLAQFFQYFLVTQAKEKIKFGRTNGSNDIRNPNYHYWGAKTTGRARKTAFRYHWETDKLKAVKNLFFAFATGKSVASTFERLCSISGKVGAVSAKLGSQKYVKVVIDLAKTQASRPTVKTFMSLSNSAWSGYGKHLWENSGSLALAGAYGTSGFRSLTKLCNMDKNIAIWASKETLNLATATALMSCHLMTVFGSASINITILAGVGGALGIAAIIAVEARKVWKEQYRKEIVDALVRGSNAPVPRPASMAGSTDDLRVGAVSGRSIFADNFVAMSISKFVERLFHPTYFVSSLSGMDELGKVTTVINTAAADILETSSSEKHPAIVAFALSIKMATALLPFKHIKYYADGDLSKGIFKPARAGGDARLWNRLNVGSLFKTMSGPCFHSAHVAEGLHFLSTYKIINLAPLSARLATIPGLANLNAIGLSSLKNHFAVAGALCGIAGVAEFMAYAAYKKRISKLTAYEKESQFCSLVNAVTKAYVVHWGEQESKGRWIPKAWRANFGRILGLTNVSKILMAEEKAANGRDDHHARNERAFAASNNFRYSQKDDVHPAFGRAVLV